MPTPTPIPPDLFGWIDQSPTLATIVGGLILAAILYGLSFVPKLKPVYEVIGQGIARFFKWVQSWRVNGKVKRDSLVQQGYDKRGAEVQAERSHSLRPAWRVDNREGDDICQLHNSGYVVSDVAISAEPELFVFADGATEALIMGPLGDNRPGTSEGKQFRGEPTLRGRREGVTFNLSWVDQNSDEQPKTAGGDLPGTVTLPAEPLKPVVQPTWQVGHVKGKDHRVLLDHTHEQSKVKNVSLECNPAYFTFMGKHEWSGEVFGNGRPFPGEATEIGHNLGVTFTVTYDDVNDDQQTDVVHLPEGKGLYGYPGMF